MAACAECEQTRELMAAGHSPEHLQRAHPGAQGRVPFTDVTTDLTHGLRRHPMCECEPHAATEATVPSSIALMKMKVKMA